MSAEPIASRLKLLKGREIRSDSTYVFYFFTDEDVHELTTGWVSEQVDFDGLLPIGTFPSGDMLFARFSGALWALTHDEFEGWNTGVGFDEFLERVIGLDQSIEDEVFDRQPGE